MKQDEIDRILKLMRHRDHLGLLSDADKIEVLRALADEVPGLLAEVIRCTVEHSTGKGLTNG